MVNGFGCRVLGCRVKGLGFRDPKTLKPHSEWYRWRGEVWSVPECLTVFPYLRRPLFMQSKPFYSSV
jgi:hypothetical protein